MSIYTHYAPTAASTDQRDAARRYVQSQPDADTLLDMLGLVETPPAVEQPGRGRGYRRDNRRGPRGSRVGS